MPSADNIFFHMVVFYHHMSITYKQESSRNHRKNSSSLDGQQQSRFLEASLIRQADGKLKNFFNDLPKTGQKFTKTDFVQY